VRRARRDLRERRLAAGVGDERITTAWNGAFTQSGESVRITNLSYNATIAAGGSTSLGFQGTWSTSAAVPTAFTLNGAGCS